MSKDSKISAADIRPNAKTGDIIGYVAVWYGGGSYSLYSVEEDGEFFPSIAAAVEEFRDRHNGRSSTRRIEWTGDGFIASVDAPERLLTPAVDETACMDLHAMFRDPDGDVTYGVDVLKRLEFGPRGGVRIEEG